MGRLPIHRVADRLGDGLQECRWVEPRALQLDMNLIQGSDQGIQPGRVPGMPSRIQPCRPDRPVESVRNRHAENPPSRTDQQIISGQDAHVIEATGTGWCWKVAGWLRRASAASRPGEGSPIEPEADQQSVVWT